MMAETRLLERLTASTCSCCCGRIWLVQRHRRAGHRAPDRRRNHHYIRVEWPLVELNGKFYLAPPKDGSRRDIDIPEWLFALLGQIASQASRCRCPRPDDGTSLCGSKEVFLFLGSEGGHPRRSNYSRRIFRPAADGIYPAQKRRADYHTEPWRVHCTAKPWPGIPIPMKGTHRTTAEREADCSGRR